MRVGLRRGYLTWSSRLLLRCVVAVLVVALRVVARRGLVPHVAVLTPSLGGAGEPPHTDRALPTPPHACLAAKGARGVRHAASDESPGEAGSVTGTIALERSLRAIVWGRVRERAQPC